MQRRRAIAGPPLRPSTDAWAATTKMIIDTLAGDDTMIDEIARALAPLERIGPVLVAAGHLHTPMVLVGAGMRLEITVPTGATATEVDENLNPVPGGRSAGPDWMLHLPPAGATATVLASAIETADHLTCDAPPLVAETAAAHGAVVRATGGLVDVSALDRLRETP